VETCKQVKYTIMTDTITSAQKKEVSEQKKEETDEQKKELLFSPMTEKRTTEYVCHHS
jgi:hypothetical protein